MCNLFHHLLKEVFWFILTAPMCMLKYILEVVWYIMWEILVAPMRMLKYILEIVWYIMWKILTAPMRMLKYILGPQETYEGVVRKNPSTAIKNARSEDEKRWWK